MKIFRKTPKKNDKISKNIINIDMVKEKKNQYARIIGINI